MYLLRLITKDKSGKFMVDNWRQFEHYDDAVDHAVKCLADEFQCFEAKDITNEIFHKMEELILASKKEARRIAYENLKAEFDPENPST